MAKITKKTEHQNKAQITSKREIANKLSDSVKNVANNELKSVKRLFNLRNEDDLVELVIVPKKSIPKLIQQQGDFVRIFQESTRKLAENGVLSEGACKLLLFLLSTLEFDNWIPMNKSEISAKLGWGKNGRKIAKFMRELLDSGVIERAKRQYQTVYSYRLKLEIGYKMEMRKWDYEMKGKEKEYVRIDRKHLNNRSKKGV